MSGAITGTTLAIMGGVGAAGALGGAAISANAAGNAASTQANAADSAAQLQYQASQNALGFQEQQYNQSQANMAPWLNAGANGLSNLQYLMGVGPQPQGTSTGAVAPSPVQGTTSGVPGQPTGAPALPTGA